MNEFYKFIFTSFILIAFVRAIYVILFTSLKGLYEAMYEIVYEKRYSEKEDE